MTPELQSCFSEARSTMEKTLDHMHKELVKIRAGKANPSMLDGIMVDAYGTQSPINQVGNISTPDAKTLSIQPWDKSLLPEIEKALMAANIGLTPQNDGEFIRLSIPPLTEERRKDLAKQAKSVAETNKVSLRSARRDAMDMVKMLKDDGLPEDMAKKAEGEIQNITNEYNGKIDKLLSAKETEIMTV